MNNSIQPTKEIVTISEMARTIGLSRARFYQLINEGMFPLPSRNPQTNRPFFDRQQQAQCLLIRQTNQGANGRAILFYARRLEYIQPRKKSTNGKTKSTNMVNQNTINNGFTVNELKQGLRQLGFAEVSPATIRKTLAEIYPDGHEKVDQPELLMAVFRHLKRQDSPDNVAR